MRTGLAVEGGSPAGTAGARRQCRHGGRPTGRSSRSNCSRWSARRTASSAAARTVERGSCAVAGGEFSGRRLLSSSNPQVPMRCSPRLDCSSFFAGGVLVRCSSLRVLDEHCRLRLVSTRCVLHRQSHLSAIAIKVYLRLSSRFNDLLGCCICNSVLLFRVCFILSSLHACSFSLHTCFSFSKYRNTAVLSLATCIYLSLSV
nr:uncharacterized protein LOC109776337 isoform X1 [Aegilops tauschii subsp. strangulata]